ncbi:MAG TPA: GNAT family N-acetyltransferase [Dongiaceae bacterium]|jgi:ribosomal protein S18 acetylase RimI-like enzyme|nr:GNAT family N-acetyltransferase [Dongiaceae bacterium]
MQIEEFSPADLTQEIDALASLLHACVLAGASISFILPFSLDEARAFWRDKVAPGLLAGTRHLLAARQAGRLVGAVQLGCDVPPNQRRRADVSKLLVHPDARRQGIARRLMIDLERVARREGRQLLVLDTREGDAAEPLYRSIGYHAAGVIPHFARAPEADRLEDTVILYKELQ